jgi:hypothetical protein
MLGMWWAELLNIISGTLSTGAPPAPTSPVAGYSFWLDANDATAFTYSSSNIVSQWDDNGGSNNATQGTVSKQPTRETGVLNGKAVVRFSGGATKALNLGTKIATGAYTLFIVINRSTAITAATGFAPIFYSTQADASPPNAGIVAGGYSGAYTDERISWNGTDGGQNFGVAYNAADISSGGHVISFDKNSSTGRAIRIDNTSVALQNSTTGGNFTSTIYSGNYNIIGNFLPADQNYAFSGDIAEILLYGSQLSSGDIDLNASYLKAKWGTP